MASIPVLNATRPRIGYLDSLRCIATLAVFFQHLLERHDPERYQAFLSVAPGVAGVVLFFYVSGFVIPFSVQREISVRQFALRRLFRIYPTYLFMLSAIALLAASGVLASRLSEFDAPDIVANLLLVQDYVGAPAYLGVSWTLSLEFAWYAGFALMFYRYREADLVRVVSAYSLALVALSLLALAIGHRLPVGRFGMLGAALVGYATYRYQTRDLALSGYRIVVCTYLIALLASQSVMFGYFRHPNITLFNTLAGWSLASLVFLGVANVRAIRESVLIDNPLAVLVGTVSYSIYLSHPVILDLSWNEDGFALHPALITALTLLVSVAMYRLVERPGVRFGRRVEAIVSARSFRSSGLPPIR